MAIKKGDKWYEVLTGRNGDVMLCVYDDDLPERHKFDTVLKKLNNHEIYEYWDLITKWLEFD